MQKYHDLLFFEKRSSSSTNSLVLSDWELPQTTNYGQAASLIVERTHKQFYYISCCTQKNTSNIKLLNISATVDGFTYEDSAIDITDFIERNSEVKEEVLNSKRIIAKYFPNSKLSLSLKELEGATKVLVLYIQSEAEKLDESFSKLMSFKKEWGIDATKRSNWKLYFDII